MKKKNEAPKLVTVGGSSQMVNENGHSVIRIEVHATLLGENITEEQLIEARNSISPIFEKNLDEQFAVWKEEVRRKNAEK